MKKVLSMQLPAVLGLALMSGVSLAGPFNGIHPLQSDRFVFGVGGYMADITGDYSIDRGTDIDADLAGVDDDDTLPAMAFHWRLSNNTRLQGEYFDLDAGNRTVLARDISLPSPEDTEFAVGAEVRAQLDMTVARIFYGYSFIKNDTMELGAGIGLHYLDMDASLAGNATVDGIEVASAEVSVDEWGLLPNIGGYANYAFSPKWLVSGRVDWISANVGDYDGTLWNVEGAIQYQLFKHFGVGAAYRYLSMDLSLDKGDDDSWSADLEYSGPMFFFTANF